MEARKAELLPVPYFHLVFTLPPRLPPLRSRNKAKVYGLLFQAAAETLTTIAGDPKHLGAEIGLTAVLHTWGQNLDHHPTFHCIVPGGGLSPDRARWIRCRPGFFLPVRVLSRCSELFLDGLVAASTRASSRSFRNSHRSRIARPSFPTAPLRTREWMVFAKQPFTGPAQVLAYLARTRIASPSGNSRLWSS